MTPPPPCSNFNHFHPASQGSKELVHIIPSPFLFQLHPEERRERSVRTVKKTGRWLGSWMMHEKYNRWTKKTTEDRGGLTQMMPTSFWCVHCRQWMMLWENPPIPGGKGSSELFLFYIYIFIYISTSSSKRRLPWLGLSRPLWLGVLNPG